MTHFPEFWIVEVSSNMCYTTSSVPEMRGFWLYTSSIRSIEREKELLSPKYIIYAPGKEVQQSLRLHGLG